MTAHQPASQLRTVNTQSVGLGCGTLIIIALLVLFLGRADVKPLERKIDALQTEVVALQAQVEDANTKIDLLISASRQE